jgi:hypothetical protein
VLGNGDDDCFSREAVECGEHLGTKSDRALDVRRDCRLLTGSLCQSGTRFLIDGNQLVVSSMLPLLGWLISKSTVAADCLKSPKLDFAKRIAAAATDPSIHRGVRESTPRIP